MSGFEWVMVGGFIVVAILMMMLQVYLSSISKNCLQIRHDLHQIAWRVQEHDPVIYKIGKDIDELNRRMYDLNDLLNPRIKD